MKKQKRDVRKRAECVPMYHIDELAYAPMEQLAELHANLEGELAIREARFQPTYDVEVELCYVQREYGIRIDRSNAHAEWMKNDEGACC